MTFIIGGGHAITVGHVIHEKGVMEILARSNTEALGELLTHKSSEMCCKSIDVVCVKKAIASLKIIVVVKLLFSILGVDGKH